MVSPGQLDETVRHAGPAQPPRQEFGLPRRNYPVFASVGEERRWVAGIHPRDSRSETITLGEHVPRASEEAVHTAQVAHGRETGQVGGRVEGRYRRHPGVLDVTGGASGGRSGVPLRVGREQNEVTAG